MKHYHPTSCQSGAALITSLIFLTVLTILGMSTLGTALLESRMAGNARDKNLAFQAAEIGLRDAESYIRFSGRISGLTDVEYDTTTTCTAAVAKCDAQKCTYGLCYNGGTMNEDGTDWVASPVFSPDNSLWNNAIQYYKKNLAATEKAVGYSGTTTVTVNAGYSGPDELPLVRRPPEYLIEAFQKTVGGPRYYYRITVRAYGQRSGTRVMLQEVYAPS